MRTQVLDLPEFVDAFDPEKMLEKAEGFADQWRAAREIGEKSAALRFEGIESVLVLGMGGSAIAGDLLRGYLEDVMPVPVAVNRDYGIPRFAGGKTLVIASSYSGNTAETLSATQEAIERQCPVIGITTGGKLADILSKNGFSHISIPKGYSPRAALGFSFVPLLIVLQRLFGLPDQQAALDETEQILGEQSGRYGRDVPAESNRAKGLAAALSGKLPVVYGAAGAFESVAYRWRCQINENAKRMAISGGVAEMNHNEIVGWAGPRELTRECVVVNLLDKGYHPEIRYRFECMSKLIARTAGDVIDLESRGDTLLARLFSLIHLGDFVSVYLALLEGMDPTPVDSINTLKQLLSERFSAK
jgi:glucose/mannose-6-phosphate isomerase